MKPTALSWSVGHALLMTSAVAWAGPHTEVPSAADPGDPIDLHVDVGWDLALVGAAITREQVGAGVDPSGAVGVDRELVFDSARHTLRLGGALGVFRDTWVAVAMPIVLSDQRELRFDDAVSADTSSTIADGILPMQGYDADDPTAGFPPGAGGDLLFRGPSRKGLTHVSVGLGLAPMNQKRDETKPTWKLGANVEIAIGKMARFDRDSPGSSTGVSTGVHHLHAWTSVAKRVWWAEPYFRIDWHMPLSAKSGSPFSDLGFGARRPLPMSEGAMQFGFEAAAFDRPDDSVRVGIDVSTELRAFFEGRALTPVWEMLAYAGDDRYTGPLVLDADPVAAGMQATSHPGITTVENYLQFTGSLAVRVDLGPHVQLAGFGSMLVANDHALTFDDAGVDLPTCSDVSAGTLCETEDNDRVNPGTSEVNPNHVDRIHLVGHRYRQRDTFGISVGAQARIRF